jgi:kynurenine formamidase
MTTQGNWGRWGEDDERGALNLLDQDTVLAATRACRTGRVYQLGKPVQREGVPAFPFRGVPQRLSLLNHTDRAKLTELGAPSNVGFSEDMVSYATHSSTHIDALCHVDYEGSIYNGHPATGMTSYEGAAKCGIEKSGGFAARGVLVDVATWRGVDCLPVEPISLEDFLAVLDAQGTEVRPGDVVLVRTGWMEEFFSKGASMSDQPGIGIDVTRWLAKKDVVAVAADNSSVEVTPWDGDFLVSHIELLVRHGIYLIENVWLADLARDRCHEFLFFVSPLIFPGATGSPVNPIAIG